jgi:hypothetical protein
MGFLCGQTGGKGQIFRQYYHVRYSRSVGLIYSFLDEIVKEFFNIDMLHTRRLDRAPNNLYYQGDGITNHFCFSRIECRSSSRRAQTWATFYDEGRVEAKFENNIAYYKVTGLTFKHRYFEYLIMGFLQKALKIFGMKGVPKHVTSMAAGDDDIYYQFAFKDS